LLGWIVGPWLVLECFGTKLIHYYLPCFPACSILVGWLVVETARREVALRDWRLGRLGSKLLGCLGFGAAIVLVGAAGFVLPRPLALPAVTISVVLTTGTLFARILIERGQTLPAVRGLVVTWAFVMLIFGVWLLPAAEPFRFSRIVGEKLAALSARTRTRPAMMTFQEPGLVYALGHSACDVRGYDEMAAAVVEGGPILIPLLPSEIVEIGRDPRFVIRPVEPISGFNLNKGKVQELEFTIVEASGSALTARALKQSLVK
jgi:4-amino-4-deoxy-L-arabinose transferase-like glycosyltransferase